MDRVQTWTSGGRVLSLGLAWAVVGLVGIGVGWTDFRLELISALVPLILVLSWAMPRRTPHSLSNEVVLSVAMATLSFSLMVYGSVTDLAGRSSGALWGMGIGLALGSWLMLGAPILSRIFDSELAAAVSESAASSSRFSRLVKFGVDHLQWLAHPASFLAYAVSLVALLQLQAEAAANEWWVSSLVVLAPAVLLSFPRSRQ